MLVNVQSLSAGCISEIKRQKGGKGKAKAFTQEGKKEKTLASTVVIHFPSSIPRPKLKLILAPTQPPLMAFLATPSCLHPNFFKKNKKWVTVRYCWEAPDSYRERKKATVRVSQQQRATAVHHQSSSVPMFLEHQNVPVLSGDKFTGPRLMIPSLI